MKRRRSVGRWNRRRSVWLMAAGFVLLGVLMLSGTRAAVYVSGAEAESGLPAGKAVQRSGSASGGSFVTFGEPRSYVALGDSVASGDGINYGWKWTPAAAGDGSWVRTGPANPVWEPTTDLTAAVQACRRSAKAYPYLVAAATGSKLYNPSCSGSSVLHGILGNRTFSASLTGAAQLGSSQPGFAPANPAYDAARPDVVSLTVGMDDINFSEILDACYLGATCVTAGNDATVNTRLTRFKADLATALAEIKRRGDAAGKVPWVVLTTYYDPFNPDSSKVCNDTYFGLGQGLGANEIDWMRGKMRLMNEHIKQAATAYPKAKVVDLQAAFAGHEFCAADPWVYGISIWYSSIGNPAPFHPTPEGQAAISKLLVPVISGL